MGLFPEVRPEDAEAQRTVRSPLGGAPRSATLRRQQTPLSESGTDPVVVLLSGFHLIHSPVPFPKNHHHPRHIQYIRYPP